MADITGGTDFPIHKTIVAQNVWYEENEDLLKVAQTIIHKALNLPNIGIRKVTWKSGQRTGKGLVKIELLNDVDVQDVLKKKNLLQDSLIEEIRIIFLRQSKKEETLIMEQNMDTVL